MSGVRPPRLRCYRRSMAHPSELDALFAFLVAAAVSALLTPLTMRIARVLGAIDEPRERGLSESPTPLLGGLAIFAGTLVASVPGGPNVSIVSVTSTIGPAHLTYYRTVRGRRVPFSPRGVSVPERCPHGGFPFAATFGFQDASTASATTTVPCPARRRRGHA